MPGSNLLGRVAALLLATNLLYGCTKEEATQPEEAVGLTSVSHLDEKTVMATINEQPVTVQRFDRTFAQRLKMMRIKREDLQPVEQRLMETGTFESLVSRTLLIAEAQKQGFAVDAEALQTAKNEILKSLPEGMTPELFMKDMGISMQTFENEIREDMLIAMLQESVARSGTVTFDQLIAGLEKNAKVKIVHAPGGGEFNKVGNVPSAPQPGTPQNTGVGSKGEQKHWRDQAKELRRDKANAAGMKPWEKGYPE